MLVSPYIKFIVWAVFLASGMGLVLLYQAPSGAEKPPDLPDAPTARLSGVVKDFGANPNGDIDRLYLGISGSASLIHFPPHAARQVMQIAPKGSTAVVWVSTGPAPGPPGKAAQYRLARIQVGDALLSIENIPPPPPAAGKTIVLEGTVDSLLTGRHGEVTGLILNGYSVVLPPHLAHSIAPLLHQGKPVEIRGYERNAGDGFVNIRKQPLVKPYRMTIDSTDYLL